MQANNLFPLFMNSQPQAKGVLDVRKMTTFNILLASDINYEIFEVVELWNYPVATASWLYKREKS